MKAKEAWEKYCLESGVSVLESYEAWQFGVSPDKLANLVVKGIKTATASLFDIYAFENEKLPHRGEYNVILNSLNEAVCIIKTVNIEIKPFCKVTSEHAYKEGEGDRSLEYWRKVHKKAFNNECRNTPIKLTDDSKVVCEEFELVYVV